MIYGKLDTAGRVTIPKPIRVVCDLEIGDDVVIEMDHNTKSITISKESEAKDKIISKETYEDLLKVYNFSKEFDVIPTDLRERLENEIGA